MAVRTLLVPSLFSLALAGPAFADSVPKLGGGGQVRVDAGRALDDTYRIGSEWGKHPVTTAELEADPALARAARATARVGGATGFYLGKFNGMHVMATNHHVCDEAAACLNTRVNFPLMNKQFRITTFFGTWTDVDLALFAITVPEGDEAALAQVAGNFNFAMPLTTGQMLTTVGFGIGDNPQRRLVANRDSDCKVFSQPDEYRFMADPDALNPGPYRAWSFANGCDVSHGDSGSAMVDRETGNVVGIIWTGKIPKSARVQDSAYLDELLTTHGEDIWTELSYAVPAAKIGEYLRGLAVSADEAESSRAVYRAILGE